MSNKSCLMGFKHWRGGIPGFALEPKFASQISIGALPLWRHSLSLVPVTPTTW